jgi:putative Mn2+ efflux pump MntP
VVVEEKMKDKPEGKRDDRSAPLIGGCILIGFGLLFLLINLDILPSIAESWPIIIIIIGLALIIGGFAGRKRSDSTGTI